jgi:glycosyltransferase involved in cell wall biosynthesis
MERRVFTRTGTVIAVSRLIAGDLEHEVGVPRQRLAVIHNGVDVSEFRPGAEVDELRGDATLRVLFAGDLNRPQKGLYTALRAVRMTPGMVLSVAGDHARSPFTAIVETDVALKDRVRFLGFRRDMADVYREHQALVFPSNYDSFGLVVLEAMASGLAVVVSARAGVADLVQHEQNGFILQDPRDADTLAHYLSRLCADPDLRRRIGRNARDTALRHDWQQMARQVHQVYIRSCTNV